MLSTLVACEHVLLFSQEFARYYKNDVTFRTEVQEFKELLCDAVMRKLFPMPTSKDVMGSKESHAYWNMCFCVQIRARIIGRLEGIAFHVCFKPPANVNVSDAFVLVCRIKTRKCRYYSSGIHQASHF